MARIRTIKPEFWQDEKLSVLDPLTRLVFLGLISQADDAGRLVDNVKLLDGLLFPETDDTCREALDTLARVSRIIRYTTASGQRIIQITNWDKHQKVDKPSKQVLPGPDKAASPKPADSKDSREARESVASESRGSRAPTMDHGPRTMEHGPTTSSPVHAHESLPGFEEEDAARLVSALQEGKVLDPAEFVFGIVRSIGISHGDKAADAWHGMPSAKRADWLLVAWEKALTAKAKVRRSYIAGVIGSALVDGIDLASPGDQGSCAPPPGTVAPPPVDPQIVRDRYSRQLAPLLLRAGMTRPEAEAFLRDSPLEALEARLVELMGPPQTGGSRGAA